MSDKIRRMVLLAFKADAPQEEVEKLLVEFKQGLVALESQGVRHALVGPQTRSLGVFADEINTFTHGVSMDFEGEDALKAYQEGELHSSLREKYLHLIEKSQSIEIRGA